jgi:ectoine hydroxylase
MAHHPRLVEPLQQLFGEGVYLHQFKINAKAAFEGDVWQWHQDYTAPGRATTACPSHRYGTLAAGHDESTTSHPLWTLDAPTVTRLCAEAAPSGGVGIVAPTGKPGSVLMFHGNLVHASPPNITPYLRKIVHLTLCAVSNHITKFTRLDWSTARFRAHRAAAA